MQLLYGRAGRVTGENGGSRPGQYISCYSNGYIFYTPTDAQLDNCCTAQEDCDCIVGAGWRAVFEAKAHEMLLQL